MDERAMAQSVYDGICGMLDSIGYHYDRHDEDLCIQCTVHGEDLPMEMIFIVHPDRQIVSLYSPMPFTVPEDKRIDLSIAVNVANYGMVDGSFDYNMQDGSIRFRLTASYADSILGPELFRYMLACTGSTVDAYNDRFFMLSKGMIDLEKFVSFEQQ